MGCTFIISAAVPGREAFKFLICCFGKGLWKRVIFFAAIDQDRNLALLDVGLRNYTQEVYEDVCERRTSKSLGWRREGWATTAAWMTLSIARSNTMRAIWNSASRSAASGTRSRTTVTVTGSAVNSYTLPFETFDDLARTFPRVFSGMFPQPCGEVKGSLKWGSHE
jgi:hypothetical protein